MTTETTAQESSDFGFTFVGNYLCLCSRIEAWTANILSQNHLRSSDGNAKKIPHLFGQKLKAITDLCESSPEIFSKPQRVAELMNRFSAPAKMRSNLAHSTLIKATCKNSTYYLFHNNGTDERFWLTESQMKEALIELKKVVKEITDQKLKTNLPA